MSDNLNTGHGHVRPRPDGVRARCGGPAMCRVCQQERAALAAPVAAPLPADERDMAVYQAIADNYAKSLPGVPPAEPSAWGIYVDDELMRPFGSRESAMEWAQDQRIKGSPYVFHARPLFLAATAQPAPAAVPAGWVLVPVEPTPEMVAAYLAANHTYWKEMDEGPAPIGKWRNGTPAEATAESYVAMLAAAPQPAPTEGSA